ncbi:MAG: YIP1 family protein [Caldilineaceae bacterium]|nr:YIP1 family protein [Caldilineaceae bacterium]
MDFAGMIQTWIRVLSGPNEETFEREQASPNANLTTALIWTVIAALVTAILGFVQSMIFASSAQGMLGIVEQMDLPPESSAMINQMMAGGMFAGLSGAGAFLGVIITPIMFLIGVGFVHLLAKMLGGQGDFGRYAYLAAAIGAPVSILNAFLGFIPVVGGCVGFLLLIYSIVLNYFAIKVAYSLTSGRAIVVILIPILILVFAALCFTFVIAAAFAGVMAQ